MIGFVKVPIVLKIDAQGSEDGIHVKLFRASDEPQLVEENLAKVFIGCGIADAFCEKKKDKQQETKPFKPQETKPFRPQETK